MTEKLKSASALGETPAVPQLKRWSQNTSDGTTAMRPDPNGAWVRWHDVAAADALPPQPQGATPAVPQQEICLCAAVLMFDGYIVRGHRHADCIRAAEGMTRYAGKTHYPEQGFVTSRGRFVNRKDGAALQIAAGIESQDREHPYLNGELYSEDLY